MSEDGTVGQAVAKVSGPGALVQAQAAEFAKVLPAHIGEVKFTRWALTCIRDPKLSQPTVTQAGKTYPAILDTEAGRLSVMSALMDCAALGLEPGRTYHLAPYAGTVTGITDYKGEIELISRANRDASVIAMLVREKDDFAMRGANVPPKHDADWFGDRGPVVGGYAYLAHGGLDDSCSLVVRISEAEFLRHREKARTKNVWDEWPESMRLKTLVHQLRKWVAWSAEWLPS